MGFAEFLYRYKERGVVERGGQKFKRYVKVPLLRTKHKQAARYTLIVLLTSAAVFAVVRRLADRAATPPEAVE